MYFQYVLVQSASTFMWMLHAKNLAQKCWRRQTLFLIIVLLFGHNSETESTSLMAFLLWWHHFGIICDKKLYMYRVGIYGAKQMISSYLMKIKWLHNRWHFGAVPVYILHLYHCNQKSSAPITWFALSKKQRYCDIFPLFKGKERTGTLQNK